MITAVLVALGGALGASGRFVADGTLRERWRSAFPLATVVINLVGSAALGVLMGAHLYAGLPSPWFTALGTGVCGGFTTFSTAMVETVRLAAAREVRWAVVNIVASVGGCVLLAWAGVAFMAWRAA